MPRGFQVVGGLLLHATLLLGAAAFSVGGCSTGDIGGMLVAPDGRSWTRDGKLLFAPPNGLAQAFCRCRMLAVKLLGFYFREKMEGTVQRAGERFDRPFRFDFDVHAPSVLGFATTAVGACTGTVRIDGLAKDVPATGRLELSPVARKTIRYVFDFTADDGKKYRFDGSKSTTWRRHIVGWTTLPGKVYDADGAVWGDAVLRFSLARDLRKLLRSIKVGPRAEAAGAHAGA